MMNISTDKIKTGHDDEIDFLEIILIIWNNKKLILATALLCAIITYFVSTYIIKPVYETNLNISINMPEIMNTKYGDLTMPIDTNLEYINLFTEQTVMQKTAEEMGYEGTSLNAMKSKFKLPTKDSNIVNISVSANSPEESVKLAQTAYENYYEYLDIVLKTRALSTFENTFNVRIEQNYNQIDNLSKSLESDKQMLQKVTDQIDLSSESGNKGSLIDYVALGKALGYAEVSTTVIQKEQQINQLIEDNKLFEKYLEEIEDMNNKIRLYNETGDGKMLLSENFDFVSQNIQLLSNPRMPQTKSSPNLIMNLGIGTLIGVSMGISYIFIKKKLSERY